MQDLDINKLASSITEYIINTLSEKSIQLGYKTYRNFKIYKQDTFNEYYKSAIRKHSYTKTIFNPTSPLHIDSIYIDLELKNELNRFTADSLSKIFEENNNIIITGTAGCGKSTLLKKLFIHSLHNNNYIPFFIEIRSLKLESKSEIEVDLISIILNTLQVLNLDLNVEEFYKLLKSDKVVLLFDGFDELSPDKQEILENELIRFRDKYYNTPIVLTSRPSSRFNSWNNFTEYYVCQLTKEKALELIYHIDYDPEIKNSFADHIEDGLYESHTSFLSNPLLLSIMLLTFTQDADIPHKMHLFYENAFIALYQKHDATKVGFKRYFKSGLQLDEFKDVLAAFSLLTYIDTKFSFYEHEIYYYLRKSKDLSRYNDYVEDELFHDMLECTSILIKDGLIYSFTHRSFQEYFAAEFILNTNPQIRYKLLDHISIKAAEDNVFDLIYEKNRFALEDDFLIPYISDIKYQLDEKMDETLQFVALVHKKIDCDVGPIYECEEEDDINIGFMSGNEKLLNVTSFIKKYYNTQYNIIPDYVHKSKGYCKELHHQLTKRDDLHIRDDEYNLEGIIHDEKLSRLLSECAYKLLDIYDNILKLPDLLKKERNASNRIFDELLS